TLHLPPHWYPPEIFRLERPRTYLNCVSRSQRGQCPAGSARSLLDEIENAVPIDHLASRCGKRRFVVAMGRICPEKGFHLALDAAARAGAPMFLAGSVFPYEDHRRYFQEQ